MKTGISYPSHSPGGFSMVTGTAQTDYPVANLGDLRSVRRVFKANAGEVVVEYDLGAEADVGFLGLVHHNAEATATFRHILYDSAENEVYDSGDVLFFPGLLAPEPTFRPTAPHVLDAVKALYGRLELSAHTTGWIIGGLEVAGFWEWSGVNVPREFGLVANDVVVAGAEGADSTMAQFKPRLVAGTRDNIDVTEEEATILRFQRRNGIHQPFVWVWDYDDPSTWAREAFLVRNETVPAFRRIEWPAGSFSFRLVEHLG